MLSPPPGHTFVADNLAVHRAMMSSKYGDKLKDVGVCYHRYLTDAEFYDEIGGVDWQGLVGLEEAGGEQGKKPPHIFYNHWQKSFSAATMEQAELHGGRAGLAVEWTKERERGRASRRVDEANQCAISTN